ncbi:hypothetical protein OB920_13105 [Halobacteria archaeon HArc-gm2]|nr:hypothetical protein [Halobacteria archaeon HArc-gm2]
MPPDPENAPTDSDDVSMTTVSAQVAESKKARWEQAVEESDEYDSVSNLIRISVTRELGDEYVYQKKSLVGQGNIDFDTDELLNELDKRFEDVNDRIDRLAAEKSDRVERNASLTNEIIDHVPTLPTMDVARDWIDQRTDHEGELLSEHIEPDDEGRAIASSIRLANYLDVDNHDVRQAMYNIEKGSSRFKTIRERGETWMFAMGGD